MLMEQKDEGLENWGSFGSPYSPWKPNLLFSLLLGLGEMRPLPVAMSLCIQKWTQPKQKCANRAQRTACHPLQLPDFVGTGMHTLKRCCLASSTQAGRFAATFSFLPIPTAPQVSSKPLTDIPFPKRDSSFSWGYEAHHCHPCCYKVRLR